MPDPMTSDAAPDLEALLALGLVAARGAAALLREKRPAGRVQVAATKSSPTDVVTALDTAVEGFVRETIRAQRPGDGFLAEEGGAQPGTSDVRWVLDPIDGTVNFVYGIPAYAVSIAAEVAGRCCAGVVLDVESGEEFTAVLGAGAYLRRGPDETATRLRLPPPPALAEALVATGFGYDARRRVRQAAAVARLLPRVGDIRRIGAASLDLCNVAAGRVDAYVEQGLQPWDLAAGGLIAREAGAVVTGLAGGQPAERLVVACAPALHADFGALVEQCGF